MGSWQECQAGLADGVGGRIRIVQEGGEDGQRIPWCMVVLRAGMEELSFDNIQIKELFIVLAVIPKGLVFPLEIARPL